MFLQAWQVPKLPLLMLVGFLGVGAAIYYFFKWPALNLLSLLSVKYRPVGDPGWFVRWVYSELDAVLGRKGHPRATSATVEEYAEQVKAEGFIAPLSEFSELYSRVDYGAYQPSRDDAQRARAYYLQVYRSL